VEHLEKSVDVEAPLRAVYNQWTQFEEFPRFMDGVKEVRQLDDRHLFWSASILGKTVEWEAEIYEQVPDMRIAWRSTTGHPNAGAVFFEPLTPARTRVTLALDYEPLGASEKLADALGALNLRIDGDLKRFRDFMDERGRATGSWRGEIREGDSA
jgi:uncharacterized membrane protein